MKAKCSASDGSIVASAVVPTTAAAAKTTTTTTFAPHWLRSKQYYSLKKKVTGDRPPAIRRSFRHSSCLLDNHKSSLPLELLVEAFGDM
jgi:hypothetical protein